VTTLRVRLRDAHLNDVAVADPATLLQVSVVLEQPPSTDPWLQHVQAGWQYHSAQSSMLQAGEVLVSFRSNITAAFQVRVLVAGTCR